MQFNNAEKLALRRPAARNAEVERAARALAEEHGLLCRDGSRVAGVRRGDDRVGASSPRWA